MEKRSRIWLLFLTVIFTFGMLSSAFGMHIMEGYLPPGFCVAWGVLCVPFLVWGICQIKKILKDNPQNITLLAMSGAFIFVISSLKIPSVTGSCSHMTGTGLGAILFGPAPVVILGTIVLLFQSLLLAHGGVTTLGANVFSMAIAGPVVAWILYRLCKAGKMNTRLSVFFAAFVGNFVTYCVTSMQLAIAFPSAEGGLAASAAKFLGIFAPTQLPLAIMEGLLTVMIIIALESYGKQELKAIGFFKGGSLHEQSE